jgi:hypothetical protein
LIALAERWGIGDDGDREDAVSSASEPELRELVETVDAVPREFWDWLVGPDSEDRPPSREYVAMTNMTLAADSARIDLERAHDQ